MRQLRIVKANLQTSTVLFAPESRDQSDGEKGICSLRLLLFDAAHIELYPQLVALHSIPTKNLQLIEAYVCRNRLRKLKFHSHRLLSKILPDILTPLAF